jgi:hypothetical protein
MQDQVNKKPRVLVIALSRRPSGRALGDDCDDVGRD